MVKVYFLFIFPYWANDLCIQPRAKLIYFNNNSSKKMIVRKRAKLSITRNFQYLMTLHGLYWALTYRILFPNLLTRPRAAYNTCADKTRAGKSERCTRVRRHYNVICYARLVWESVTSKPAARGSIRKALLAFRVFGRTGSALLRLKFLHVARTRLSSLIKHIFNVALLLVRIQGQVRLVAGRHIKIIEFYIL